MRGECETNSTVIVDGFNYVPDLVNQVCMAAHDLLSFNYTQKKPRYGEFKSFLNFEFIDTLVTLFVTSKSKSFSFTIDNWFWFCCPCRAARSRRGRVSRSGKRFRSEKQTPLALWASEIKENNAISHLTDDYIIKAKSGSKNTL